MSATDRAASKPLSPAVPRRTAEQIFFQTKGDLRELKSSRLAELLRFCLLVNQTTYQHISKERFQGVFGAAGEYDLEMSVERLRDVVDHLNYADEFLDEMLDASGREFKPERYRVIASLHKDARFNDTLDALRRLPHLTRAVDTLRVDESNIEGIVWTHVDPSTLVAGIVGVLTFSQNSGTVEIKQFLIVETEPFLTRKDKLRAIFELTFHLRLANKKLNLALEEETPLRSLSLEDAYASIDDNYKRAFLNTCVTSLEVCGI